MKPAILTLTVYILFTCFDSPANLGALEERIISLGAEQRWQAVENRSGITELGAVRPWPVLALSSGVGNSPSRRGAGPAAPDPEGPDLVLSFDEKSPDLYGDPGGRYSVNAGGTLSAAGPEWARHGEGAAFFSAAGPGSSEAPAGGKIPAGGIPVGREVPAGPLLIVPEDPEALFAAGRRTGDFSLEFWLYPLNLENGEQILNWTASRPRIGGGYYFQHIRCSVARNRLTWNFGSLFTSPGGEETRNITLNGSGTVVPKRWSHHLIRFDADSGLLEYLVDGAVESIAYTTDTGAERGEVYSPLTGLGGEFILGKGYTGLLDEFRIHRRYAGRPGREFGLEGSIGKYPPAGGRLETRIFDLGRESGLVLRLEARGGRLGENLRINDYLGPLSLANGSASGFANGFADGFADGSAVQFFIRTGDNPYRWTDGDWQVVEAGTGLPPVFQGRYVQAAANLYPGADGETSPYLEELRIVYRPNEIPRPPPRISARARDGAVELSWGNAAGSRFAGDQPDGYLVYYGTARGEYFGTGALQGPSPIDTGKRSSLRIEGLDNGVLYYFAVASYKLLPNSRRPEDFLIGEFSREVTARPLLAYTLGRNEPGTSAQD